MCQFDIKNSVTYEILLQEGVSIYNFKNISRLLKRKLFGFSFLDPRNVDVSPKGNGMADEKALNSAYISLIEPANNSLVIDTYPVKNAVINREQLQKTTIVPQSLDMEQSFIFMPSADVVSFNAGKAIVVTFYYEDKEC